MTREEQVDWLCRLRADLNNGVIFTPWNKEFTEALTDILEQEQCEDEYIKVPKKALKYRTAGMVAYNAEWLKNHFDIERAFICGAQEQSGDLISRDSVIEIIHRFFTEEVDKIPTKKTEDGEVYVIHKCQPLFEMNKAICKRIKALPSVSPTQNCVGNALDMRCEDAISRQKVLDVINLNWDYRRNCIRAIEKLPPVKQEPRWIPVSEMLPEHYQNILFSTKTDRVFEGRYFKDETEHQWYSFRDECFAWNNVVTAWMPLPKPYEPQERSDKE